MVYARGDSQKHTEAFGFSQLESLRLLARQIQLDQIASLQYFAYGPGYQHVRGRNKISISSSATCVLSLVATGNWTRSNHSKQDTNDLLKKLIAERTSAKLLEDNPFTTAWILEAVTALKDFSDELDPDDAKRVAFKETVLQSEIEKGSGGVSIAPYPKSAYLTQLVVRVLRRRGKLTYKLEKLVTEWAWAELARQLALVQAKSKTQDAFAVAYLLMLVTAVTPSSKINPEQASIQRAALKTVFECQLGDGTWPLSRPLFHYPNFGNAYCYEYEMLTQLLQEPELKELLLEYLPKLKTSAESISNSVYRVEGGIPAWTSGHHPNQAEPESWATASVYHYIHALDRLLAEAVRRNLFQYLETPLPRTVLPSSRELADFAPGFLDSTLEDQGIRRSLKMFLWEKFVKPLSNATDSIVDGRKFDPQTPRAAIFFGPPGTSKTQLSQKIADFLGWPLLSIDPSHLLGNGMDGMQAEANAIFRMLEQTERVVVLFDEFDELVRDRVSSGAQPFSRLLTTAMLPKLARLYKQATLVFIIATNNIGEFDLAIRRQGRFDRVVQIMPPTYEAKMANKVWGSITLDIPARCLELGITIDTNTQQQLGDLTYLECVDFVAELAKAADPPSALLALSNQWAGCTLRSPVSKDKDEKETWEKQCREEAKLSH
jgi:hypothetical protein